MQIDSAVISVLKIHMSSPGGGWIPSWGVSWQLFSKRETRESEMKGYLVTVVLMLCACSAINVNRGAELVRVTNREPGRECKFLGDVTGSQGNRFTGGFTSDANLETGARNDLKNKAFDIGGNVVYLLFQRDSQTGDVRDRKNVTLSGNVYRCPD
jgi:Domain of unknown function (DUF4156)